MLGPPHFHFASDATAFFKCIPCDVIYIHPWYTTFSRFSDFAKDHRMAELFQHSNMYKIERIKENDYVTSATFWMKVRYDIDQVNYLLNYEILDRQ